MKSVTIAICNYNYERFLADAIDSALAQDYPATEVLVVDDGSTDGSRELIERYGTRISTAFKENGGQVSAYNRAIEEVDSDVVILLDADDILYPDAVSAVMQKFGRGAYEKVQFRLDVMTGAGELTGTHIPHSDAPVDSGSLLRDGWLYPSPPASGNAYSTKALRRFFPIPETAETRYGADFFAIYGAALLGPVASIACSLGGYRVHQSATSTVSFANAEDAEKVPKALLTRWTILRQIAHDRLGIELPATFHDFSYEKAIFCTQVHGASIVKRYKWFALKSRNYLHSIVANPFWSMKKKIGLLALSSLCLFPYSPVSDYAVRYIANPLARRSRAAR
ncbi:glycosyltransferase family 2 protein [Paraburkholderia sp. MMS20-SJTR3]|uniref:Glycosyltransferase family 2 protein n=1 Tax=Paraburkholderia sejongensis TaxID=2886946 RepID=A0ABS8K3S4_9BURK|nr:glycosyltransferase family A protein [Paraburkholderia sp. MMS20-SJTR3]MCC8396811.1 glycosyltransferase family 2 protein [Paraburkholderia sp. MMS20-SJTR3]